MRGSKMRIATFILAGLVITLLVRHVSVSFAASQAEAGNPTIAFVTRNWDTRMLTINLADPQGANVIPFITNDYLINPVWSPDGTQLAFSAKAGGSFKVYVIGGNGSNPRIVSTHKSLRDPNAPAWSPDGTQILYAVSTGANAYSFKIYKVNVDGSGEEELKFEDLPDLMDGTWLAWSPDGTKIAVHTISDEGGHGHLYILDADGTNPQRFPAVAEDGDSYERLAWSPDGTKVVLSRLPTGAEPTEQIAVANADGSNHQVIVSSPPVIIASASWSPDGSQIVFIANEPITGAQGDLWVVDADGSDLHKLNIADDVAAGFGTSWALIPNDFVTPAAPILLEELDLK